MSNVSALLSSQKEMHGSHLLKRKSPKWKRNYHYKSMSQKIDILQNVKKNGYTSESPKNNWRNKLFGQMHVAADFQEIFGCGPMFMNS